MKIAVIGATGLVGRMMMKILEEVNFPVSELIPAASERSAGQKIIFRGNEVKVLTLIQALEKSPDIALFSAGSSVSLEWAPRFAQAGTRVIDNSAAWRMNEKVKLVVPEVNGHIVSDSDYIIANPNCSTIQLVVALQPIHKKYGIKRIVISTYQSVSGTGKKALVQMDNERRGISGDMVYPYPIDKNCIPHGGSFLQNGYTTEEMKLVDETRKILDDYSIGITATVVRIPVEVAHSESVNLELNHDFEEAGLTALLKHSKGIKVLDNPSDNIYPVPLLAAGTDQVYIGRIRRDYSRPSSLNLWIVADNLRKGAATNAVQIARIFC